MWGNDCFWGCRVKGVIGEVFLGVFNLLVMFYFLVWVLFMYGFIVIFFIVYIYNVCKF